MIKIPNNICICQDCMQRTFDGMNQSGFRLDDILGPILPASSPDTFSRIRSGLPSAYLTFQFQSHPVRPKMPNISMINLTDLQNMMPHTQKVKKKKPKEKKEAPVLDIQNIPAPHKIKAKLDCPPPLKALIRRFQYHRRYNRLLSAKFHQRTAE